MLTTAFADATTFAFFDCDIATLSSELERWHRSKGDRIDVLRRLGTCDRHLAQHVTPPNKAVILRTDCGWSCYIDNDRIRGTPYSTMFSMAERLRIQSIGAVLMDEAQCDAQEKPFGVGFCHYDGRSGVVVSRSVMVIKDGGKWSFHPNGTPLEIEDVTCYANRKKRERLSKDAVTNLLIRLGVVTSSPFRFDDSEWVALSWQWRVCEDTAETAKFFGRLWELTKRSVGLK